MTIVKYTVVTVNRDTTIINFTMLDINKSGGLCRLYKLLF